MSDNYLKLIKKIFKLFVVIFLIINLSGKVIAIRFDDIKLEYKGQIRPSLQYSLTKEIEKLYLPDFHVHGIYVTGWVAGVPERIENLINLINNTVLNTMVIDIKDQEGFLSYKSNVKLAEEIGANRNKIDDIKGLLNRIHNHGIYTIARIVTFKDPILAKKRPEFALTMWDSEEETVVYSKSWVNPEKIEVWEYNLMLAKEAIKLGFDEVQFDYIRYPALTHSPLKVILNKTVSMSDLVNRFVLYAKEELEDLAVPISIDLFGLTTVAKDDLGIGQNFDQLSDIINIISPMVYPSHYGSGSYGIRVPESEPYKIVYNSMIDAKSKISTKKNVILRPWLQDFSLRYKYSFQDVRDQIQAVEALGIKEWLLWNPRSRYTRKAVINPPN